MFGATDLCQEHVHIFPSMNFSLKTDSFMIWCKFKWEIRNLLFLHTTENNIYMNRQAEHQVYLYISPKLPLKLSITSEIEETVDSIILSVCERVK